LHLCISSTGIFIRWTNSFIWQENELIGCQQTYNQTHCHCLKRIHVCACVQWGASDKQLPTTNKCMSRCIRKTSLYKCRIHCHCSQFYKLHGSFSQNHHCFWAATLPIWTKIPQTAFRTILFLHSQTAYSIDNKLIATIS